MVDAVEGVIALVGGTGALGKGLAYRFMTSGLDVVIGSRSEQRATSVANELLQMPGARAKAVGGLNTDAVRAAGNLVVLAVPYAGHAELVAPLPIDRRILVSCVNPLGFDRVGPYGVEVADRSAAEEAARLHPGARVVGAFHHVAASKLLEPQPLHSERVLVCGDDHQARQVVCQLATAVTGEAGVEAGPLRNARYLEPFTAVLISVNKKYKVHAGVALTGL